MKTANQFNVKRSHKATRYSSKDYHSDVVNKRQKTSNASPININTPNSQSSITSYLVENKKKPETTQLKIEDYFKVPSSKNGFNILSIRRSFYSIKTNANIVSLIKKNVINNNIVKWTVQSKLKKHHTRTSLSSIHNKVSPVPSITNESFTNTIISSNYHRLCVEDFILLNAGDCIKVLIPEKEVKKKSKIYPFDSKFISCLMDVDAPTTQIGGPNNSYFVLSCVIKSCPNRPHAIGGIDRITFQKGFFGNQNFGCLLDVEETDIVPLLKWRDVFNGKRKGLQVWSSCHTFRFPTETFFNYRQNDDILLKLLTMMFDECFGDRIQAQLLVIAYYQARNKSKQCQMNKLISTIQNAQPVLLCDGSFKDLMNEVDKVFKNEMISCYSTFNSITEPILSRTQILNLVSKYKSILPNHYKLMKEVLGFHLKENQKRNQHLQESFYYDRLLLYQFLQQGRIRNCKHMPHWGMVAAADAYAKGDGEKSIHTSVHSGYSTTISTFLSKTKQWRKSMPNTIQNELSTKQKFVCCLDNNQKGYTRKYQRDGSSNKFIKVTATCIKECFDVSSLYNSTVNNVDLTYYDQAVPSPIGLPIYETILDNTNTLSESGVLDCINYINNKDKRASYLHNDNNSINIDSSGSRVNTYKEVCLIVQQLNNIRQCASGYVAREKKVYFVNHLPNELKSEKVVRFIKYFHTLKHDLLKASLLKRFQYNNTSLWNSHIEKVVKLIIPPVSLHDEIRTDGYGMALIELLVHLGLLYEYNDIHSGIKRWEACKDFEKKTVYLCLDGLSIERHRCFYRKLLDLPLSFTEQFKQAVEFQKVFGRVIELSGPLHMSFHMLQCIYNLYGGLLRCSQICVDWKKIKVAKVSDNYRLCCSLAMIVYEEITRMLLFQYLNTCNESTCDNDQEREGIGAIHIAQGFLKYVNTKAETSGDLSFVYICRYWLLMNSFKMYYDSQKNGDFLMMEKIENDFCGVFLLMGKNKYYELCLGQMERRYNDISQTQLNEIRINASCRYRRDNKENVYSMHVLDELMENVNYWTKMLPLGADQNSWVEHSPNVMVARRCLNFVNNEYRQGLIDFESAVNYDDNLHPKEHEYSKYIQPRCNRERSRLFELFQLLYRNEIDGRVFNTKEVEENIEKLTTPLKAPSNIPSTTELESCMESINNLNTCELNSETMIINEESMIIEPVINDNGHTQDETQVEVDDDLECSGIMSNVPMALCDIIKCGKERMKELDIATHRTNVKQLRDCHDQFLRSAFESMIDDNHSNAVIDVEKILRRETPHVSSFLVEFEHLKTKHVPVQSNFINRFHQMTSMQ